jgi:Amt family ammonium transporter
MLEDRVKRAMVESINQVGHALGIQTIAEWVENRPTLEVLKTMGVDYAQGYWLCRPQPLVHEVG